MELVDQANQKDLHLFEQNTNDIFDMRSDPNIVVFDEPVSRRGNFVYPDKNRGWRSQNMEYHQK